jgi:hypothetical protein
MVNKMTNSIDYHTTDVRERIDGCDTEECKFHIPGNGCKKAPVTFIWDEEEQAYFCTERPEIYKTKW